MARAIDENMSGLPGNGLPAEIGWATRDNAVNRMG